MFPKLGNWRWGREAYGPLRQSNGGDYIADRALASYVNRVGQKLARVSDRKLPYEFKVVNNPEVNAWALPGGKIAINRGLLLELENEAELAAVLGHEVVHAAAKHSVSGMSKNMLIGLATEVIAYQAAGKYDADKSALIGKTANLVGNLVSLKYGRDAERDSDHYGMIYMERAGYDPRGAITLQQKFVELSKSASPGWFEKWLASHPPSQERVENNRKLATKLQQNGEFGRERYQSAIAHLKSVQPAYSAYENSKKALGNDELSEAESLARKAIDIEPDENLFHLLLGDILTKLGRNQSAMNSYNRAAEIQPNHFVVYERRGLLQKAIGDESAYRSDMTRAANLLPTSVSYLALGQLAEKDGDPQLAIEYLKGAASSNSFSGKTASREFNRLDRLHNPHNYLQSDVSRDEQKILNVTISNPLQTPVSQIEFTIEYGNPLFPEIAGRFIYPETIKPGDSVTLTTDIGPVSDKRFKKRRYRVLMNQAQAEI